MKKPYGTPNMMKRDETFERLFGKYERAWHEKTVESPHIDIYCFPPGPGGRDFFTLATAGMSDRAMNVPHEAPQEYPRRIELVFYCAEPRTEYAQLLRGLAHFPFDEKTWIGPGHTMETASIALLGCKDVEALLFIPSPIMPDDSLPCALVLDGDPVSLLWVVPVTMAECALIKENGLYETMMHLFNKQGRPYVFDPCKRFLL